MLRAAHRHHVASVARRQPRVKPRRCAPTTLSRGCGLDPRLSALRSCMDAMSGEPMWMPSSRNGELRALVLRRDPEVGKGAIAAVVHVETDTPAPSCLEPLHIEHWRARLTDEYLHATAASHDA